MGITLAHIKIANIAGRLSHVFSHPFMVCCDEDGKKDIFRVFPIFSNIEWKKMDLIAGGRC